MREIKQPKRRKTGAPTREERDRKKFSEAFEKMTEIMEQQSKVIDKLLADRERKAEPEPENSRTIENPRVREWEPSIIPMPPPDEPSTVYKCGSRGLWMCINPGYTVDRGNGNYRIIPPQYAVFENGTFRTNDPDVIEKLDKIIGHYERRRKPPKIMKVKAEEIADVLTREGSEKEAIPLQGDGANLDEVVIHA